MIPNAHQTDPSTRSRTHVIRPPNTTRTSHTAVRPQARFFLMSIGLQLLSACGTGNDASPTPTPASAQPSLAIELLTDTQPVSEPQRIDFGTVLATAETDAESQPEERTLRLRNDGTGPLTILAILLTDPNGNTFSSEQSLENPQVPAGESILVTTRFHPGVDPGQVDVQYEADLLIRSSDVQRPEIQLPLLGVGSRGTDQDKDNVTQEEGDCDDTDPNTFPGAEEVCDGIDNDCDEQKDEASERAPSPESRKYLPQVEMARVESYRARGLNAFHEKWLSENPGLKRRTARSSTDATSECAETTGVVTYKDDALDGYTLVGDDSGDWAYLVDMEGNMIQEWEITAFPAKFLPGGKVVGSWGHNSKAPDLSPDAISVGVQDWDGNALWSFSNYDDQGTGVFMARQHHDLELRGHPVGYYTPKIPFVDNLGGLVLAHHTTMIPEISSWELQDDVLYEFDENGVKTDFEWHATDHISEFGLDEAALEAIYNFPSVLPAEDGFVGDWLHTNSASYLGENKWFDAGDTRFHPSNIIIDSRNANFIAIISHETGEVVWRVGPDFSEGTPEHELGQILGQHHVHMIPRGLPGEGNILMFDNGGLSGYGENGYPNYWGRTYSRVLEFDPITLKKVWEYGAASGEEFISSPFVGSAQRLPNGNTLFVLGVSHHVIEVTPDKRVVWEFLAPYVGWTYRAYRVPPEWLPDGINPANYPAWSDLE